MHDGNVAGEQVRELRQKERRAQIVHQPLVEEPGSRVAFRFQVQNVAVHREIALAATGGDNHVHPSEDFLVALDASRIQRQSGGIGSDALPGFHLTLVALFGDLGIEVYRRPGMDDVWCETLLVYIDAPRIERVPVRVQPFAERGRQTDAGDPDFRRSRIRRFRLSHELACCGKPMRLAMASMNPRKSGFGKGTWRNVIVALHLSSPPTLTFAAVMAKPEPS